MSLKSSPKERDVMVSSFVMEKFHLNREFSKRFLSSFLFAPMVALVFFLPEKGLNFLCWLVYGAMVFEVCSPKIQGKYFIRLLALVFCFFGIESFIYCRRMFGSIGCLLLICVASFTDTGGYVFGKIFKGPKMCPKISPKKTWVGLLGGIFLANIGILCMKNLFPMLLKEYSVFHFGFGSFFIIQILIASAVLGDLLESSFKRRIGVKDMGTSFPGHGGVLDRLDSLLMSSIVFALINILL